MTIVSRELLKGAGMTKIVLVGLLLKGLIWGAVAYVAIHFITKFW